MPLQIKQAKLREENIGGARIGGKTTQGLAWLYAQNYRGEAALFATPKGNLYTEKAFQNKLDQAKSETLEAIIKRVEGMKKDLPRMYIKSEARIYRQALNDLLTKLQAEKELIEKEI